MLTILRGHRAPVERLSVYLTQTPLTIFVQLLPGGTGLTVGENELGPPTAFSVGTATGADDDVDGGVVFGSSLVVLLQPAVSAPIAMIAEPPSRRLT